MSTALLPLAALGPLAALACQPPEPAPRDLHVVLSTFGDDELSLDFLASFAGTSAGVLPKPEPPEGQACPRSLGEYKGATVTVAGQVIDYPTGFELGGVTSGVLDEPAVCLPLAYRISLDATVLDEATVSLSIERADGSSAEAELQNPYFGPTTLIANPNSVSPGESFVIESTPAGWCLPDDERTAEATFGFEVENIGDGVTTGTAPDVVGLVEIEVGDPVNAFIAGDGCSASSPECGFASCQSRHNNQRADLSFTVE